MHNPVRHALVITISAVVAFGGVAVAAPSVGLAAVPPGCETAWAKGGTECVNGAAPFPGEFDCYKNAGWGALPGLLTGSGPAALAGAAVACAKGASSH